MTGIKIALKMYSYINPIIYSEIQKLSLIIALNTFISFMIPIVYLILIIPLEYILELYSKYEVLFVRMSFKEAKDKKILLQTFYYTFCTNISFERASLYALKVYTLLSQANDVFFEFFYLLLP